MDEFTSLVVTTCKAITGYTRSIFSTLRRKHGCSVESLAPGPIGPQTHLACSYSRAIQMHSFTRTVIQEISRAHSPQNHPTKNMHAGTPKLSLSLTVWCWSPAVSTKTIQCRQIQIALPREDRT